MLRKLSRYSAQAAAFLILGFFTETTVQSASLDPSIEGSVNGVRSSQLFHGWPLLVQVTLFHPEIFDTNAAPLTLAADAGRWSDLLTLQVLDSSGASVAWPLTLLNSPGQSATLDGQTMAQLTWSLAPEQTSLIQTGAYQISVTLDTSSVSNQLSWKGTLNAIPMDLHLDTEPSQLSPLQNEAKYTTFAQYHLALGNSQEALNQANLLLLSDPTNIAGLSLKGSLLADLNQNRDALNFVNQALDQIQLQFTNPPEPPADLLRLRAGLTLKLRPGRFNSVIVTNHVIYLEWNANPGHTYNLEHSLDLFNWTPLAPGLVAPGTVLTWSTNKIEPQEFFRVR